MNIQRVRVGIRTSAPPTRDVYANLNHAILVKAGSADDLQEQLAISTVLSAFVSIFDWDVIDDSYINVIQETGQPTPDGDPQATNTVLFLAMGSIMNCVKPISKENAKYVENRWLALSATLESTGATVPTITPDANALISIAVKCRPYIKPGNVVRHLINGDPSFAEMYNQIKMVFSYAGMKLVEEMKRFSHQPYMCAVLLSSVMEQAKDYLSKYNAIKNANQIAFEYARIVLKTEIEPLDAAHYPDLYWAAYYSMRKRVSSNFKTSAHEPITPRDVIKRFAKVHLTDFGALSEENKRILEALGVNLEVARKKADQLTKHRRAHSSDESESDFESDDEPPKKRPRQR